MTCTALDGNGNLMRRSWEGERDDDGHRTFIVKHQVSSDTIQDGPAQIMACSDLPQVGDLWVFGNDSDTWAFCWPSMKVKYLQGKEGEAQKDWEVEQRFSTRPMHRCNATQIENPLSEPFLISGNFVKYTKEAHYDRFGRMIRTSSMEKIHGQGVEFDFNRMSIRIVWNVSALGLSTISTFIDTVNDSVLWGMSPRCVKLSNYSFERVLYGVCTFYYRQTLEFDIDWNSFDRQVMDEGHKALNGEWAFTSDDPDLLTWRNGVTLPAGSLWKLLPINGGPPDRSNPQHYTSYKDRNGEMARVVLDGNGEPASLGDVPAKWARKIFYSKGVSVSGITSFSTGTGSGGDLSGNVYECTNSGVSSASLFGPTGTGSAIVDGGCVWRYLYTATRSGSPPGKVFISYYPQSNMLLLGIPTSL